MNDWTHTESPRIWRSLESDFRGDELMTAAQVYTDETLGAIESHGFNGVWLRGRLYGIMRSNVLPELNDAAADRRLDSLRTVIERGQRQGVGVYLFLNEPLALPADHPVWRVHPELRGEPYVEGRDRKRVDAMCLSAPLARRFFSEAIGSVLEALSGLAGVILITTSEHHSHCWSHIFRYSLDDGIDHGGRTKPDCSRCRDREPAEIVLDQLSMWRDAVAAHAPGCRVLAWNWSWSMWYPEPQAEIVSRIPPGVELMLDWERGGELVRDDETVLIDEYSLSFSGPGHRFTGGLAVAPEGTPVHARLQLGTTHEIATVPNLPLMLSLHAKLRGMSERGIAGTMACWNFGCSLTLNTFAVRQFLQAPECYQSADVFLDDLAQAYFGVTDSTPVIQAWRDFNDAFTKHYPFSMAFVYWSPINDAPGHPLSLHYKAQRLGPSHLPHEFGDDAATCLGEQSIEHVVVRMEALVKAWTRGVQAYEAGLAQDPASSIAQQAEHRRQELSCARMIGFQMRSAANFFRFHQRRMELTGAVNEPCTLPPDSQLLHIMRDEIANARAALPVSEADSRLGWHQEGQTAMYSPDLIRAKISAMQNEIDAVDRSRAGAPE